MGRWREQCLDVQEGSRALKSARDKRYGEKLAKDQPTIPWMVRHAADCISRYRVGDEGKTAYERLR